MIFDAHGDILTDMYIQNQKSKTLDSFSRRHLKLYKQAGINASIFVNYTDPSLTDETVFDQIFEVALREIRQHEGIFKICFNYDDLVLAETQGKIGVILGVEGLKFLRGPDHLKALYQRGLRHMILTWNEVNDYGAGISSPEIGLSKRGIDLIKQAEAMGMIIDLAHAGARTFDDILANTTKPIIISHGNAKALYDHPRNYTDEQLMQIKDRNGVIGLTAVAAFLSDKTEEQTVQMLAKHIDYVVHKIGIDHVGLGLDICYYLGGPFKNTRVKGLETIGELTHLFDCLSTMGYDEADLEKIKSSNFMRVIKEVLG